MKKGFFLLEVIISVVLLGGVILALLQVSENSFALINKLDNEKFQKSALTLAALKDSSTNDINSSIHIKDVVSFKDDEARKALKNFKVKIKQEMLSNDTKTLNGFSIHQSVYEKKLSLPSGKTQTFYSIKLE